jgi:hypothetical protein
MTTRMTSSIASMRCEEMNLTQSCNDAKRHNETMLLCDFAALREILSTPPIEVGACPKQVDHNQRGGNHSVCIPFSISRMRLAGDRSALS